MTSKIRKMECLMTESCFEPIHFSSPSVVVDFLNSELNMASCPQESFVVLFLNLRNYIEGYSVITQGLVDRAPVHAREVFRLAVMTNCTRIILAHNHPSGNYEASDIDIDTTKALLHAAKILEIRILDHIIVSSQGYFSFEKSHKEFFLRENT